MKAGRERETEKKVETDDEEEKELRKKIAKEEGEK
jgi:hypothetical protein